MTVASTTSKASFAADGTQAVFPYPFRVLESRDLKVAVRAPDGTETALEHPADYTVTGAGQESGGTAVLAQAPAPGSTVVLYRGLALTQDLDLANNDPFDADQVEGAFDRLTMIAQQIADQADRAMYYPVSTPPSAIMDPAAYARLMDARLVQAQSARAGSESARDAAQAAQAAAEQARDTAQAITGFPASFQTPAPALTGPALGDEGTTASGGIANFDPLAAYHWTVPTALQSAWSFNAATGAWSFVLPLVDQDTDFTVQASATRAGELRSDPASWTVRSLNVPIQDGPTITFADSPDGFPDGSWSGGTMALAEAGAHSVGVNNSNGRQFTSATPQFVLTSPLEFTAISGTAAAPAMQHAFSGQISAGDELWFKPVGSGACAAVTVGSVSESGGGSSLVVDNLQKTDGQGFAFGSTGSDFIGQQFTAPSAFALQKVRLQLDSVLGAGLNRTVTLDIYADDGGSGTAARPTGPALATATVSAWTTARADTDFALATPLSLASGTKYWFVVSAAEDGTNNVAIQTKRQDTYANGFALRGDTLAGLGTIVTPGEDIYFGLYAPASVCVYTLGDLSPAQAVLPEMVFLIRADPAGELMHLARGTAGQAFVDGDFSGLSAIAAVAHAPGPELTVTGQTVTFTEDAAKVRLALKLRGDLAVGARAKSATLYTEEMPS